ncbi:MAG: hypothetical protein DRO40_11245 [Thermoprotei archaeon]|nr:MAG: hypothetical protein DRO40_11245 [Thermoprotei archaeon]
MSEFAFDPSIFLNYGIAGFLAVYLTYFITNKLNSKLDRLADKIGKLNNSIEKLVVLIDAQRGSFNTHNEEDS